MKLDDIKGRCHIDEGGHWIWKGALSEGKYPHVWAPDHSRPGSPMKRQAGRRAVWHLKTGKPIPAGWRVYGTCEEGRCLNPDHSKCGPTAEWGAHMASSGRYAGSIRRQIAGRKTGRKATTLTPETYMEAITSNEMAKTLAARLGVLPQTISKARNGRLVCFEPAGGMFSGLVAANESNRRRA